MSESVHLYYHGLNIYPPSEDEECWKFCEGLEASGFYSNTILKWLKVDLNNPSSINCINNSDSLGVIFLSANNLNTPNRVLQIKRPIVFTDFSLSFNRSVIASHPDAYLLTKNEEVAAGMVARHLVANGHKRIFFLKSVENLPWEVDRLNLFSSTIKHFDPHIRIISAEHDPITEKSYRLKMRFLYKKIDHIDVKSLTYKLGYKPSETISPARLGKIISRTRFNQMRIAETALFKQIPRFGCTAVVGSNDKTAVRYMYFCQENGIRIPEDISLVGFDNNTTGDHRLTSVDFGYHSGGTVAANIITQPEIRHHQKSSIIELPCRLIDRNTVGSI
ncbi:MAG: substrate-binding domain-containing protein [Chitinivibrionales bacterium]